MKTKVFSITLMATLFLAQFPLAMAQGTASGWAAVQAMPADERLIVKQKDGTTVAGRMIEASDSNLTLSRDGKVVNISRDSIQQIHHVRGKAAKTKWGLIGAGLGGAVGAGIGATKVSSNRDDSEIWVPVGLMFGAISGTVAGLVFGATRRERSLIYQAP
jgi:hypothetical protein